MIQHLLLMTLAPPLILLGAPVMPFLHGFAAPIYCIPSFRLYFGGPPSSGWGRFLSQPAVCWLAAVAALVGWHIPAAFTLALQGETVARGRTCKFPRIRFSFLVAGCAGPGRVCRDGRDGRCSSIFFLATLPVRHPLRISCLLRPSGLHGLPLHTKSLLPSPVSKTSNAQAALMWTCVTFVYLLAAAILTTTLLSARRSRASEMLQSDLPATLPARRNSQPIEVA